MVTFTTGLSVASRVKQNWPAFLTASHSVDTHTVRRPTLFFFKKLTQVIFKTCLVIVFLSLASWFLYRIWKPLCLVWLLKGYCRSDHLIFLTNKEVKVAGCPSIMFSASLLYTVCGSHLLGISEHREILKIYNAYDFIIVSPLLYFTKQWTQYQLLYCLWVLISVL